MNTLEHHYKLYVIWAKGLGWTVKTYEEWLSIPHRYDEWLRS
jgi:hypothetical protein